MKYVLLLSLLLGNLTAINSQIATSEAIKILHNLEQTYIYNEGQDTIVFEQPNRLNDLYTYQPLEIYKKIDLDHKGTKEIVFHRQYTCTTSFYQQTRQHYTKHTFRQYEIWNLDTKEKLFEAKYCYKENTEKEVSFNSIPQKNNLFYHYKFMIDDNGVITIKRLRGKDKKLTDHSPARYIFTNNTYQQKQN